MKIEISDEFLDDFLVQALKDGLDTVQKNNWVKNPEDIIDNKKLEAAFLTLLGYYMYPSDFMRFVEETYNGSNADS